VDLRSLVRPVRATVLAGSLIVALVAGALPAGAAAAPARVGPPSAMASTGDSITRAFHTGALLQDVPANSWSTGTNPTVNSIYNRILAMNPAISGRNTNAAVSGARMGHFAGQAANAAAADPELVTVLLGANDVCTSNEASMTPVDTYEAQFRAGMEVLAQEAPDALVYVASIPNIYRLWQVGSVSGTARLWWALLSICQSMLASPTSTTDANVQRRQRVLQRNVDFNQVLADVCAEYLRCRFDDNAAFNTDFLLSDLSTIDYFHPNVTGQAKAAQVLWGAIFDFTDDTPPVTAIIPDRDADGVDDWYRAAVELTLASDDEDLRGSEFQYQLRGAERTGWVTYTGPFTIGQEGYTDVAFRSIDFNGNVEAEQGAEIKLDLTAPEVEVNCPAEPVLLNAAASATVVASDDLSGFAEDPNGTFPLETSEVGVRPHTVEVQDRAGNTATATCILEVVYGDGEVRQPIRRDGSSVFRAGSTVPVKLSLTDADGVLLQDVAVTLSVVKVGDAHFGGVEEEASASTATIGNRFRWDAIEQQYVFNWSTRGLSPGTYELQIDLGEGAPRRTTVSLR
jgi:lysophospholipase L1-like esterase